MLSRRSFLGALGLGLFFRPDKWVEKPLPPPEVGPDTVGDFTRIVVPMAFYSHVRKLTWVETPEGSGWKEEDIQAVARQLADEIDFEVLREGYTPVA